MTCSREGPPYPKEPHILGLPRIYLKSYKGSYILRDIPELRALESLTPPFLSESKTGVSNSLACSSNKETSRSEPCRVLGFRVLGF